jgi:hypothetical protein
MGGDGLLAGCTSGSEIVAVTVHLSLGMRIEMAVKYLTTRSTELLYFILYAGIAILTLSLLTIFCLRHLLSGK